MTGPHDDPGGRFLPDTCQRQGLMAVTLLALLLALVLWLAPGQTTDPPWQEGLSVAGFVQAVAWLAALSLCRIRRHLARWRTQNAALAAFVLVCLASMVVSVLAWVTVVPTEASDGPWDGPLNEPLALALFVLRNLTIAAIVAAVTLHYAYVQHQSRQRTEAETQARIQALQARIRPHFLFNSMNTIANLTRREPQTAEQAVEDLADLFRVALEQKDRITLAEELEVTRRYLNIESLRLGGRLEVVWRLAWDLPLNAMLPGLILQPLVENAIYHGIEPSTTGGQVEIEVRRTGTAIEFAVSNPLPVARGGSKRGSQIAQHNVRERLALAYNQPEPLRIVKEGGRYRVCFAVPYSPVDQATN